MGESKDINVKTSAFDLTIHWNPTVVGSQACIFIGLLAIAFFAGKGSVRGACIVLMLVDVLTLFIGLLGKSVSFDDNESEDSLKQEVNSESKGEDVDVEVSHEKNKKSSVKTSKKTIKNKLAMPTGVTPRQNTQSVEPVKQSIPDTKEDENSEVVNQEQEITQNNDVILDMDEIDLDLLDLF